MVTFSASAPRTITVMSHEWHGIRSPVTPLFVQQLVGASIKESSMLAPTSCWTKFHDTVALHQSLPDSPHKGPVMKFLMPAWPSCWANSRVAHSNGIITESDSSLLEALVAVRLASLTCPMTTSRHLDNLNLPYIWNIRVYLVWGQCLEYNTAYRLLEMSECHYIPDGTF